MSAAHATMARCAFGEKSASTRSVEQSVLSQRSLRRRTERIVGAAAIHTPPSRWMDRRKKRSVPTTRLNVRGSRTRRIKRLTFSCLAAATRGVLLRASSWGPARVAIDCADHRGRESNPANCFRLMSPPERQPVALLPRRPPASPKAGFSSWRTAARAFGVRYAR
jgi:hypothetical protein